MELFLFVFIFFVRFSHTVWERIFIILLVVFYTFFAVAISFAVFPTAFTDLIFQSVHFLRIVYVLVTSIIQSRNVLTQRCLLIKVVEYFLQIVQNHLRIIPVSYTHLDVYKRQLSCKPRPCSRLIPENRYEL